MNPSEICQFNTNIQETITDLKYVIDQLERINRLVKTTVNKDELAAKLSEPGNSTCIFIEGQAVISPMSLRRVATQITKFINSTKEYEPMDIC